MIHLPHLETDVTQACQLSCVGCNHSVPLWRGVKGGPWAANPDQVSRDLEHLARFVHADRWGALGGEPLLNVKLVPILQAARASRVASKYEVWTNGMLLRRQGPEFWRSFDILVLSVYEGKLTDDDLEWIRVMCQVKGIELVVKDERRFPNFMTMLEPTPTNTAETLDKFRRCFFRAFSRSASYGYFFTCCCGPHIPMLVQGKNFGDDGVKIEGLTEAGLTTYLERAEPLSACTVCAGRDTARAIKWAEERDPVVWVRRSAGIGQEAR